MKVETAIGENYHFELHDALLVYRNRNTSFVTRHEVTLAKDMPPTLGPAQPLTVAFVESLMRSLGGAIHTEVLPGNVVAKSDRMIAWWTPERRRAMFYNSAAGKASHLNGKVFPQPPLLWQVWEGQLRIRALLENKRPGPKTKVAIAPFWNISHDGTVCTGSMRRADSASAASIPTWEQGFYESNFTHSNVGRITRHKGGFDELWTELAGRRVKFPAAALIEMPETALQFIQRGRQ